MILDLDFVNSHSALSPKMLWKVTVRFSDHKR